MVLTDVNRDQGFLTGMCVDVKDKSKKGDVDQSDTYFGEKYTIVCN